MKKEVIIGNISKKLETRPSGVGDYKTPYMVDVVSFDGHIELWGFSFEPHNYLKESELSGEEWRKGGWLKIFRNKVQVYEEFCRVAENAMPTPYEQLRTKIQSILPDIEKEDWPKCICGHGIECHNKSHVIGREGLMLRKTDSTCHHCICKDFHHSISSKIGIVAVLRAIEKEYLVDSLGKGWIAMQSLITPQYVKGVYQKNPQWSLENDSLEWHSINRPETIEFLLTIFK